MKDMTIREFGRLLAQAEPNDRFAFTYGEYGYNVQLVELRHAMLVFAHDDDCMQRVYSVEDYMPLLGQVGDDEYAARVSGIVLDYLKEIVNDEELKWDYEDADREMFLAAEYQKYSPAMIKMLIAAGKADEPEYVARKAASDRHPNALEQLLDHTILEDVEEY